MIYQVEVLKNQEKFYDAIAAELSQNFHYLVFLKQVIEMITQDFIYEKF
jgi:hypothetical protein